MGGWSAEREVSLRSGRACADALARLGYRVTRIDVGRDIAAVLSTVKPDVALNVLHGRPGEDGTLQGLWRSSAFPTATPACFASALAMQKDMAKAVFRAAGVPVPEGIVASRLRGSQGTPPAAALCDQADRRGVERRRLHGDAPNTPTRRRS